jgi:hypothetical protein
MGDLSIGDRMLVTISQIGGPKQDRYGIPKGRSNIRVRDVHNSNRKVRIEIVEERGSLLIAKVIGSPQSNSQIDKGLPNDKNDLLSGSKL